MPSVVSRGRGRRTISEINMVPFIDVMLVLLIVFMVTAPLLNAGVQVDLPKTEASAINDQDDKPLEVTVEKDGDIFIGETKVTREELLVKLAHTKMPFGKYEGYYLIDLPEYYVVWYANKGFPKGQLGEQLKLVHELKRSFTIIIVSAEMM